MLSSDRLDKQFSQHSDPNKKDAAVEHHTSRPSKIEELTRRLAETEAALQAVVAGQIDAVIDPEQDTPLLLREAQAQLRRSEERYHRLISRMSALILELKPDGSIIEVNDAVTQISGYKPEELLNRKWWTILFPGEQTNFFENLIKEFRAGDVSSYEIELTHKSGRIVTLELNSANYYDPEGELKRIVCFGVDITQRKRAEKKIWKSERQLSRAEGLAELGSWTWDIPTNEVTWSDENYRIHGVEKGKFSPTNEKFIEFVHPEDRQRVETKMNASLDDPKPFEFEFRIVRPDGETRLLLARGEIIVDEQGHPVQVIGIGQDITERKKTEQALANSRDYYLELIDQLPTMMWRSDDNMKADYFNKSWLDFTGRTTGEDLGDGWIELIHPEDRQRVVDAAREAHRARSSFQLEYRLLHHSGEYRWILDIGQPFNDLDGSYAGYLGTCFDLSDRKKAEAELQKAKQELETRVVERTAELSSANQRLQAVLQSLPVGVWIADATGRIIDKNEMADQIWGGEAPLAKDISEYSHYQAWWADSGEPIAAEDWGLARAIQKGERSVGEVIDIQRFDGSRGTMLNSAVPMYDEVGRLSGAVVASQDITHQRELEQQARLAAAEVQRRVEELDAIFSSMGDAVIVFDDQGILRTANPAALRAYGFNPENMSYTQLAEKIEMRYLDGQPVPRQALPAMRAMKGEVVSGERYILNTAGQEGRIIIDSAAPLYTPDGELSGSVVVWTDITKREKLMIEVERERDKLQTLIESISDEVWFCDAEGNLMLANRAVAQNLGLERVEDLFGSIGNVLSKIEVYDAQGQPLSENDAPLLRSLRGETLVGLEEFVRNVQTGELRYRSVNSAPLMTDSGEILGAVAVVRDITERKQAQDALQRAHDDLERRVKERTQELAKTNEELRAEIAERKQIEKTLRDSEERYRLVVEGVKEYAIFTLDPQGYVTSWNKGAESIKGYTAEEIIGKHFSIFFPQEEIDQGVPQLLLEKAIAEGRYDLEDWRVRKDGSQFWANIVLTTLRDEAGHLRGFSKVLRDMTRRKEADEALQRQTNFVKLLQEVAVAANQASTVEEAMQFALDRICAYTGWNVGFAYGLDQTSGNRLIPLGLSYLDDPERWSALKAASESASYPMEVDLPGKVFSTNSPVWLVNFDQFMEFPRMKLAAESGLNSGVAFPVLVGKKVVGALEFFGQEDTNPDQALLEVLAHIGTQLGRVVERKESENALRHSEARFRTIFEGASMGIELVDLGGRLLAYNPALAEMLGYSDEQLLLDSVTQTNHPANVVAIGSDNQLFEEMKAGIRDFYRQEKRLNSKDGQELWARISVSIVRDVDEKPQFAIGMVENITKRKQMEAELNELQRRLMEGRESERVQLAQELHDGPMQDLYGLSFHLKAFESGLPEVVDRSEMGEMQGNLQQVVRTLRSICGELRPPALAPFGLEKAIRSHADSFQETNPDLTIGLELMPDGQVLSEQVRLALFRIYQQALTNIVRHANAQHVMVRFTINDREAILEVQDDGKGFELPSRWIDLARQGHLGLVGAQERAESIGGKLNIESKPGEGTIMRVTLPRSQFYQENYLDESLN
jgi:PAS domain S-box-containing protein